ncbi:hypothetical protein KIW84_033374 [Lathyrus oleraceus]|uniref:CCHC-type domain-containing protein n=1 Tax=Pisum sativum TaxID=3888 RepID=A0A9D4XWG3_PEA|nr:hypothetical protein KIW84_033374 [Pisum sativum]
MPSMGTRSSAESPLFWIRAYHDMEYLVEVQLVQTWINRLEKGRNVIAQAQAIAALKASPHLSFSVVNALNSFLTDSKALWRVRIETTFALNKRPTKQSDKGKGKEVANPRPTAALKPSGGITKEGTCFHCGKTGHWKRNCPKYLEDKKNGVETSTSGTKKE